MEIFTQAEANKILKDIPYNTTRDWAKAGLFQWQDGPANGRGQHRLYSRLNLYQIALCDVLLRNTNVKSDSIKVFMEQFFVDDSKDEKKVINEFNKYIIVTTQGKPAQMLICNKNELSGKFFDPIDWNIYSSVISLKLLKDKVDNDIKTNLV